MKYDLGELNMNKKIFLSVCSVCFLGLMGCTSSRPDYAGCTGPDCQDSIDYVCQTNYDPAICPEDPFVNYTRTAADFREYGERTPRDHMISQSAAGNNLVATIPPSIEDEVILYEEQLVKKTPEPTEQPEPKKEPAPQHKAAPTPDPIPAPAPTPAPAPQVAPQMAAQPIQIQVPTYVTAPVAEAPVQAPQPAVEEAPKNEEVVPQDSQDDDIEFEDDDLLDIEVDEEISESLDDETEEEEEEDPVQDWLAEEGQNLKALLTEWSEQSGWRLIWNTNRNYVLSAGAMFRGRFADVSSALIRAFARARPAPVATFYKGNRVLVVETMEDENAYE